MERDVHDIFDVILKIIAEIYGTVFLNYVGIENEMDEVENIEFTTLKGDKLYVDFICSMVDDSYQHIEFQYPKARSADLERFFDYNIIAQVKYRKLVETLVINFDSKKSQEKPRHIGKSKSFHPTYFYLGDIDFKESMRKINIKVESDEKLTNEDEITLMLMCLVPKCKNKLKILKNINKLIKYEKLFDETKIEFIRAIIKLEIENLLSKREQEEIGEIMEMTPKAENKIQKALNEVNYKVIAEVKEKERTKALKEGETKGLNKGLNKGIKIGNKQGLKQGINKGIKIGKTNAMKKVAKNLKEKIDLQELSQITGLNIEEIKKL